MQHSALNAPASSDLILVVDHHREVRRIVSLLLVDEGFRVVSVARGQDAMRRFEELSPDLVLLDLDMPDVDGTEMLVRLRRTSPVPVVCLTARATVADRKRALDLGADDHIAKPFHGDELTARVRAVLRRSRARPPRAGAFRVGDLEIDYERRLLRRRGSVVWLGRTEWELLHVLIRNPGTVVLSTDLLSKVWGPEYAAELEILRNCISRLRRKLGAGPDGDSPIRTYVGVGYSLDLPAQSDDRVPDAQVARVAGSVGGKVLQA